VSATCDPREPSCEVALVRTWRNAMSRVATSHLDPEETYFSGYTFSYDELYDSPAFWRGQGGVLGFDLFRLNSGATEVYIQFASSSRFAARCGERTHHDCRPQELPDGRVCTMTDTTTVATGMEVQFSPADRLVITVVARNTSKGRQLQITRGDIIALVSDPRMRLPQL
jgi:hypothetical protein